MVSNVFVLNEERQWFLDEGRIDPMTREKFTFGDRVVVCSSCRMVFKESTWEDCHGCTAPGCRGKTTARAFLKPPSAPGGASARGNQRPGGLVIRPHRAGQTPGAAVSPAPADPGNPAGSGRMILRNRGMNRTAPGGVRQEAPRILCNAPPPGAPRPRPQPEETDGDGTPAAPLTRLVIRRRTDAESE